MGAGYKKYRGRRARLQPMQHGVLAPVAAGGAASGSALTALAFLARTAREAVVELPVPAEALEENCWEVLAHVLRTHTPSCVLIFLAGVVAAPLAELAYLRLLKARNSLRQELERSAAPSLSREAWSRLRGYRLGC